MPFISGRPAPIWALLCLSYTLASCGAKDRDALGQGTEPLAFNIDGIEIQKARKFQGPSDRYDEVLEAFDKFPTAESCVRDKNERTPFINWSRVGSDIEAAVCIARVARGLGSFKRIPDWLRSTGFVVIGVRRDEPRRIGTVDMRQTTDVVEALWPTSKNGPLIRTISFHRLVQHFIVRPVSIVIEVDDRSNKIWVDCTTIME